MSLPVSRGNVAVASDNLTVYALFTTGMASDLDCLTIDASTGSIVALTPVIGPAATYFAKFYGESTRVFPFDPARRKFFFLDIVQQGGSRASPITLYGIDPSSGHSTATTVHGATGFVRSFAYHPETATMILAVGGRDDPTVTFFTVNLDSGVATLLGNVNRGGSEDSPSYYVGYMSAIDSTGKTALRLGFKSVVQGTSPGLGVVPVAGGTAEWTAVPSASGEEFAYSLVRPKGEAGYLSLAPSTSPKHSFAVVQWNTGGSAKVIANLPNAHPGSSPGTGVLGYVADDANSATYAALVVEKKESVLPGRKDRWELVVVDRSSGKAMANELSGKNFDFLGAETVSLSGIGIGA